MTGLTVTAIVPAHNEEPRIGEVLEVLTECDDMIDRLVVVDDGSEDETAATAARYRRVEVIRIEQNSGKAAALQTAMLAFPADVFLFIDADLIGLKVEHIQALLEPISESSTVEMTVGRFVGGRARTDFAQKAASFLNGQRAIRATLLNEIPDLSAAGWGFETALTKHAKKLGAHIVEVPLFELGQHMKEEKRGYRSGFRHRLKMYRHILISFLKH